MPRVTVVIPLYNKQEFISAALASVVAQTYRDFCILVIDDASTDQSHTQVSNFIAANPSVPIELLRNSSNLGVHGNGNRCLSVPETEYIARLDADDIMPPTRLKQQVAFLDANPELGQLGGAVEFIGNESKVERFPSAHRAIRSQMPVFNAICQGTSVFRKAHLVAASAQYDEHGPTIGEDWLLFWKLGNNLQQANLNEIMDIYRIHNHNISTQRGATYFANTDQVLNYILRDLGLTPSEHELHLHYWLRGQHRVQVSQQTIVTFNSWVAKLRTAYTANDLDAAVLEAYVQRAFEQLYFHVNPNNSEAITELQKHAPMTKVHKKYLWRKKLRGWFGG